MILNRLEVLSGRGEDNERHWGFLVVAGQVVLDVGADHGSIRHRGKSNRDEMV